MLERPVVNLNLISCLTKDDTDLRVTICHIRRSRFRTGAHILAKFHRRQLLLQLLKRDVD
jgi:hypothetical protein